MKILQIFICEIYLKNFIASLVTLVKIILNSQLVIGENCFKFIKKYFKQMILKNPEIPELVVYNPEMVGTRKNSRDPEIVFLTCGKS